MEHTSDRILDIAQELVQLRGFNAFSYADISVEIGIRTASIHYHFPSKTDLGFALIGRYRTLIGERLTAIDGQNLTAIDKLRAFGQLYFEMLEDGKISVCSALAADSGTLPEKMLSGIRELFVQNENWLARVFREGRNDGSIKTEGNVEARAKLFHSLIHGAMILSRAMGSEERFLVTAEEQLKLIG